MGLRRFGIRLLSKKAPETKLQDPAREEKKTVRVDPLERINALKAAGQDLTIQLNRATGASAGAVSKQWHIAEIDPLTFYETVAEALGGGAYRMTFRKPDSTFYRLDGSESPETHTFTVAGKPKMTGEPKEKAKKEGIDWLQEVMKEGSVVAMILKSVFEQRGKPDEVLMELLKTAISGNGNKADPTALLANVTETVVKLKEAAGDNGGVDPMQYISQFMTMMNQYNAANKPPVATTGSNSSGLDKFFENLGAAAPMLAPMIANALAKPAAESAAITAPMSETTPDNVIAMSDRQTPESKAAFAGTGATETAGASDSTPDNKPSFNPLSAFGAPDLSGGAELGPESAAFGAVMKLRYMIGQQADPLDIASEMVDTINLIQGAKRVEGVWENYIDDPGASFDEFAPLIPEWLEHPEYRTQCREAMVKAVTEYFESEEPIRDGATEIETVDVTHETESPEEPVSRTTTDDTVKRTSDDERANDHGIIDG